MTTKDELNRQTEKRTDKKYETLDRSGIELLDKICSMTMVNWDLDEFRRTHGTLLFCIETALDSHAEAYHKYRVNAISDEMIDEFFNVSYYNQNQQSWLTSGAKSFLWHIKRKLNE